MDFNKNISVSVDVRRYCIYFHLHLYHSFLYLKPNFMVSSLSIVKLSWGRTIDKFAISWQIFAQVGLQLKFAFRIRPIITTLNFFM